MRSPRNFAALLLAVVLALCLFAFYATRGGGTADSGAAEHALVDTSELQEAVRMASLAATPEEQAQARDAWRLADHALDLTFASAVRKAEVEAETPPAGPLRKLSERVKAIKAQVAADKKRVDGLTASGSDGLELAQAQLTLDQDELDDAQGDLAREGGDKRATLQRLLQEHESSDKVADQELKFGAPGSTGTLSEQVRSWFSLRDYGGQLEAAAQHAEAHRQDLLGQHDALARKVSAAPPDGSVAVLKELSGERKQLANLDQRMEDAKDLAAAYQRWSAVVEARRRGVLHLVLRSAAGIVAILLAMVLLNGVFRRALHGTDKRRQHQLGMIARIALEVAALLLILLIIFGPPTQLSTVIGLITAGLTVVMKDFIVAFFGWFTLMGKNGIRVGDWVEIEGVSGEVIEIGLLKTVLLEVGSATATGHPTGRRVAFSNSFAMEHHYFNFSTAGQWLWDEIVVTLPAGGDPYETADRVRQIVERETEADTAEAAREWQNATRHFGGREVAARPVMSMRPGANGLEVVVRYITRAPQKNVVKGKLFRKIVELLRAAV